jgi:alpha-glucosidase
VVWALFPVLYIVSAALNPLGSVVSTSIIPTHVSFANFDKILTDPSRPYLRWFLNTIIVCTAVTFFQILCSTLAAYAFSRMRFRGRRGGLLTLSDAHDFKLLAHPAPPEWAAHAVVYQVFPDRFARSGAVRTPPDWAIPCGWDDAVDLVEPTVAHQWFGGDLDGVTRRLDHIASLGADVVYLTPFFESRSNHRYDAVSFDHVDPVLGGDVALARLTASAHARGMRVIGDLTTNHTGCGHAWSCRPGRTPPPRRRGGTGSRSIRTSTTAGRGTARCPP